jgi:hypothetical protein
MKIGFTPKMKGDWRLMLTLAKMLRLASKEDLTSIVHRWEAQQTLAHTETPMIPRDAPRWILSRFEHSGSVYLMLNDGTAACSHVASRRGQLVGHADWHFELSGLHAGRPLHVWLCHVRLEYGDDGQSSYATWDLMRWTDDDTALEDAVCLDGYGDALAPIVTDMLHG